MNFRFSADVVLETERNISLLNVLKDEVKVGSRVKRIYIWHATFADPHYL